MTAPLIDCVLAFAATGAACFVLGALVPLSRAPFGSHMTRRGLRMLGRALVVLAVVGAGVGPLGGRPAAVVIGAIAGWLLAAGAEVRAQARVVGQGDHR
ncbi:MAG: hypothetical protein D6738_01285 [Acidobacteria bacterium]|nr:MAG: hypothetical protein D6738_01285 [Acidobacteriota bacterium]